MRLVTRGNLDGLACSVLLDQAEPVDQIELIQPQDITDDRFAVEPTDILANVPYHRSCAKWFDHHSHTRTYERPPSKFVGRYGLAPSTARLVYEYYLWDNPGFNAYEDLVRETDRYDGAGLTMEDVLHPRDYILLGFTLDPRTGLGPFRDYFFKLFDILRDGTIEDVMALPEVQERKDRMDQGREPYLAATQKYSRMVGPVLVTDLRDAAPLPAGNRFLVYTHYPESNVWLRIARGPNREFLVATVGHNIFNRTCPVHVGGLLAKYGGGGHRGAGATPIGIEHADEIIEELIQRLSSPSVSVGPGA
jgi:hypothetical protein